MLPTSGGTMTGNLTLQGTPDPLTIPAGATDGYVLTSDADGNASWAEAPGASGGMANPMTASGDMIKGGSSGTPQPLHIGSTGQVLTVSSGAPAWEALPAATTGAEGVVQLAGDLSGSASAPVVAKIQSTAISAPDGNAAHYLSATGAWTAPAGGGGSGLGGVTLSGTPAAGDTVVAASSSAASWQGVWGTRPEWFGTIGTGSDGAIINEAISAIAAGSSPGPLVLTGVYSLEETLSFTTGITGVQVVGMGQMNRQTGPPNSFAGAYIQPSSSFPATGEALITVGTSGDSATNPCGLKLIGVCLDGTTSAGTAVTGCIGVQITDTADVHLNECFLANFDRTGGTGYAIQVIGTASGTCYGFQMMNSQISNCAYGLYTAGAGATDMRLSGNLWHSSTYQLTAGGTIGSVSGGGGGLQIINDHFAYPGATEGYHLSMGSAAGDSMITGCYFDKSGVSLVPVQLATAKVVMCSCHFLAETGCTAASLVSVSTADQELSFNSNQMNGNASSVVSLLQFTNTGITTALTGGSYSANVIYSAPSATAVLTGSGGAAIAAASSASVYVQGNIICT
jgi:hypothetical protein